MSQEPSSELPFEFLEQGQDAPLSKEAAQQPIAQFEASSVEDPVEDLADGFSSFPSAVSSEQIFVDDFLAEESVSEESLLEESVAEEILVEEDLAERSAAVRAFFSQEADPSNVQNISEDFSHSVSQEFSEAVSQVTLENPSPGTQRSISQETFGVSAKLNPRTTPVKAQSQTLQALQEFWQKTQPRLKTGAIALLKGTIQVLQGTVDRLERPNSPQPTQKKAAGFRLPAWVNQLGQTLATGWTQFWRWWKRVLPSLRRLLPTSINQALSDQALSAAIAGILVLVLSLSSSLLSNKPAPAVAIAPVAPTKPAIEKEVEKVTEKKAVEKSAEPAIVKVPVEQTPETNSAPNITTPNESKPISAPVPPPSQPAPPPLKLTPEQKLIAQIQDQVAEVSDQSAKGLIQSVQANFRSSRLTVNMGDGWYGLSPTQQTKLANDILSRTQQLNFTKLELVDAEKKLLARSPVVGTEMVILRAIAEPA